MRLIVEKIAAVSIGLLALSLLWHSASVVAASGLDSPFGTRNDETRQVARKIAEFKDKWEADSLDFSPSGDRLAASFSIGEGEVHVWEWREHARLAQTLYQRGGGQIDGLHYGPAGDLLAEAHHPSGQGEDISVWDTRSGKAVVDLRPEPGTGSGETWIAFTPDEHLLVRSEYCASDPLCEGLIAYDTSIWKRSWGMRTDLKLPQAFRISPDGRYIALGGLQTRHHPDGSPYGQSMLLLIDAHERRLLRATDILAENCEVKFVAWSSDGRHIAVGGQPVFAGSRLTGAAVEVFDAGTGQQVSEYTHGEGTDVRGLSYSGNGRYLIIAWEAAVEMWDSSHQRLLQQIDHELHSLSILHDSRLDQVSAVAISKDSHNIAIAQVSGRITVWKIQ
jgi:WD40 repeat protein